MATTQDAGHDRFASSVFPLKPIWEGPRHLWTSSYPEDVPPHFEFTPLRAEQLLLCAAAQFPRRIAMRYFRSKWRYQKLVERVKLVASNLKQLGFKPGDRVLMVLPNCPEFVVTWFALHWIGVEVVPANPLLAAKELKHLVEMTNARAVFGLDIRIDPVLEMLESTPVPMLVVCSLSRHLPVYYRIPYRLKRYWEGRIRTGGATKIIRFRSLYKDVQLLQQPELTDPKLPAILQPTGGTTGIPKIAVLTHENLHANIAQLHVWCGLNPGEETVLAVLPFFHVFGATVVLLSSIAGGATLILQARFDPARSARLMDRLRPTVAPMVPMMFEQLCQEMERRGRGIQGLRFCFSGSAALSVDLKNEFQERTGALVLEGYGLSEASPVTHVNPPNDRAIAGSIGIPLPGTQAKIVDKDTGTRPVEMGKVGELAIQGPQVMQGYLNSPEETAETLRDGWLHTGDLAQMDENGYFKIVDRKKDMIISGGFNVYPNEVEAALVSHPDVGEAAVVGLPDRVYGERVVAFVTVKSGRTIDTTSLRFYCGTQIAKYKVPHSIEVVNELPKSFLGKTLRTELRNRAA